MTASDAQENPLLSAEILSQALDGMCVGFVLTNTDARVTWSNRAAQRILGLDPKTAVGRRLSKLLRDPTMAEFWHAACDATAHMLGEVTIRYPEVRELKVNAAVCAAADGTPLGRALLFCDVTSERAVQIEMSRDASERLLEIAQGWQNTGTATPHAGLTQQELRILRLVGGGYQNEDIAERIHVATSTVRTHLKHIYAKLALPSRSEAIRYAIQHGLV